MLTASSDFQAALRYSHRALTRAVLLLPDVGSGFYERASLSVAGGRLRIDGTRRVWRSGSVTLTPQDSVDRDLLREITSTSRLRVERGIRYENGQEEWVTIGLLQVQDTEARLTSAGVELEVADLGSLIEDYPLITPYVPQAVGGAPLTTVEAIMDLVESAIAWDDIPGWDLDPLLDTEAVPVEGTVFTGSRWDAIQTLSESLGAVTYTRPDGWWVIRSTALDLDTPEEVLETGPGGTIVDLARAARRSDQYNAVPLRWESPTVGGLVFIVDADPSSPTYWDGPFGRKPRPEESNDTISTEPQAIAAATALLDQYRGLASSLQVDSVHNPLLEPLDVVLVKTPFGEETHAVDTIDYPLTKGTMSLSTRLLREEA